MRKKVSMVSNVVANFYPTQTSVSGFQHKNSF